MIITVTLNAAIDRIIEVKNFREGEHNRGRLVRVVPAGKGVNVSRVLAQLGIQNAASGFVGSGELELYREGLSHMKGAAGIAEAFIAVAGHTRTNTTIVDPLGGRETHISEQGFSVSDAEKQSLLARLATLISKGDFVVFSGSLPQGFSIADLDSLLAVVKKRKAKTVIDCSDGGIVSACKTRAWAVKPNREELSEALGTPLADLGAVAQAAKELAKKIAVVLVTLGAEGAVASDGAKTLAASLAAPAPGAVNTVGAGDAFLAGFLAGWHHTEELEGALRTAVAAACSKVMHLGSSDVDPIFVAEYAGKVAIQLLE
jgi:1-phosphofructokinase